MTPSEQAAWAQAAAGLLTFGAACFAAAFTLTGPKRAAELAEKLRNQNDESSLHRREKRYVLMTLLQERGSIFSSEAEKAINAIPIVFFGDAGVNSAYRRLCGETGPFTPERLRLYLALTIEVARAAGFSEAFTAADVDVGFFVTRGKDDSAEKNLKALMEQQDKMRAPLERIANALAPSSAAAETLDVVAIPAPAPQTQTTPPPR